MIVPEKKQVIFDNGSGNAPAPLPFCYRFATAMLPFCYRTATVAATVAFLQSPTSHLFCVGGYVCTYAENDPVLGRSGDFYEKRHKNSFWR